MKRLLALAALLLASTTPALAQVSAQPFTLSITITTVCTGLGLSNTSVTTPPNNAGTLIGAVTMTLNPPSGTYNGTVTLGGTNGSSFALSNAGKMPTNLTIGSTNLAAGSYAITLSCS